LIPPLVTFLPGAMLTFGMVELAYGDMVSGSSRLITGFVQLVLLTFSLAAGAFLMGAAELAVTPGPTGTVQELAWAPWVGIGVFAVGVFLHFSAPPNALPWILAVLVPTFAMQRMAVPFVGTELSGFSPAAVQRAAGHGDLPAEL